MKELKALNPYILRYKYLLFLGIVFLCFTNFLTMYAPIYIGNAIDGLKAHEPATKIYQYILLALGCAFWGGVSLFFVRQTIIVTSRKIEYDLKNDLYSKIQSLSISTIRQMSTGDLMARLTNDLNNVRNYFGPVIMYSFNTSFRFVFAIITMMVISPMLTLYALLPAPLLAYLVYLIGKKVRDKSQEIQEVYSSLTTKVQENLAGIRMVKAFVKEEHEISEFKKINELYYEKNMDLAVIQSWFFPVIGLLIGLSYLLTIWVGGNLVIEKQITIGILTQFFIYIAALSWPIISIGFISNTLQRAVASQKRINEIFNITIDEENTDVENIQTLRGEIECKNISYSYPNHSAKVLDHLSLTIKAGEKIAILGATGSGKTTLVELLLGLTKSTSGEILYDGVSSKEIPITTIRKNISCIAQDNFLFSTTLTNNISFGVDVATREDIQTSAKNSLIYDDIMDFPKQFDTIIGERGITLSGGQKQRTTIARALLRRSPIIIFDDSLSAVDTNTEHQIIKNIFSSAHTQTVLFVSHRISTVKHCDRILVLHNGHIAESGTHDELIKRNNIYTIMYNKQLIEKQLIEIE